jgi:hypothetical protein
MGGDGASFAMLSEKLLALDLDGVVTKGDSPGLEEVASSSDTRARLGSGSVNMSPKRSRSILFGFIVCLCVCF